MTGKLMTMNTPSGKYDKNWNCVWSHLWWVLEGNIKEEAETPGYSMNFWVRTRENQWKRPVSFCSILERLHQIWQMQIKNLCNICAIQVKKTTAGGKHLQDCLWDLSRQLWRSHAQESKGMEAQPYLLQLWLCNEKDDKKRVSSGIHSLGGTSVNLENQDTTCGDVVRMEAEWNQWCKWCYNLTNEEEWTEVENKA